MNPTLYIIGAGPGDPELITLKALKALKKADVILYDALVSDQLLAHATPNAKLVFVGKRKGRKEFSQEEINELIVFYASRVSCVVRLKGGDPFVFGRGHEELEYASRRGIAVEVIPGISSALAAPASAGIPLTKRGVNESFWVITGTVSSGDISNDIALAAESSATVIILMGINKLKEILSIFIKERSPFEPAAIIEHATLPTQRVISGTVYSLHEQIHADQIKTPAVIVIGKVVDERHVAVAYPPAPLQGELSSKCI
ncbi:MAG TPA: uroporphyrinogen-III C-methyltransferase [Chryseolinea sp.]|nr:uroporphyrinogen-III C-methyltransferase [Chryseolinea sp.]